MSHKKFLVSSLIACEKHEFDKIVKTYLKEVYNFSKIVLTDGKDDVGIDIKVFDNGEEKIQYQLTTQKSETTKEANQFEEKVLSDILKAKENHEHYGYSNMLFFFYSKSLTNKAIRKFEKVALTNYGISIKIVDANRIADEAEEYVQLQKAIIDTNEVEKILINDSIFPDSEKNLVFDLVGFGESSDFKMQIIESFVLQEILKNGILSFSSIVNCCKEKFGGGANDIFYEKLISSLLTSKRLTKEPDGNFKLSPDETTRLKNLKSKFDLGERKFIQEVNTILTEYNQEQFLEEYIRQLKEIYIQNFNSDVVGLIDNLKTDDLSGLSRDFLNFIRRHLKGENDQIKLIAKKLFKCCQEDNFLQKFCAGKVFSETANLSRIEKYVNTKKRVFIDTQIALFSLCYYYDTHSSYNHYFFTITRSLIKFCRQNRIELILPDRYSWEVQTHFRDSFNLIPFTRLPNFTKLGKSRNVFYNFYLHLNSEDPDIGNFEQFLGKFNIKQYDNYKKQTKIIEDHLQKVGLLIHQIGKTEYEIDDTKKLIQYDLIANKKFKAPFSVDHDATVMEFLSDNDVSVHPLQPIFLSWDKTFFNILKRFYLKNPTYQRWFLMEPGRFIDQYSLLRFTINSEVLSSEMIAYLSDDIVKGTHTLIDSITYILSDNEISLEYASKLADIRDNEIHRIEDKQMVPPQDVEGEAVIDDVFYKLTSHYQENTQSLEKFKKVFNERDLIDTVLSLITKSIEKFYETKKFDKAIFEDFDSLIKQIDLKYSSSK